MAGRRGILHEADVTAPCEWASGMAGLCLASGPRPWWPHSQSPQRCPCSASGLAHVRQSCGVLHRPAHPDRHRFIRHIRILGDARSASKQVYKYSECGQTELSIRHLKYVLSVCCPCQEEMPLDTDAKSNQEPKHTCPPAWAGALTDQAGLTENSRQSFPHLSASDSLVEEL